MRRITWVSFAPLTHLPDGGFTSDFASARYRILLPIRELDPRLYQSRIVTILNEDIGPEIREAMEADAVIFSKSVLTVNEELAAYARAAGAKIVFDVCDHHFEHPEYGAHYRAMAETADTVVCNTEAMSELAARYTAKPRRVIEDPVEGPTGIPHFQPGSPLRLLWFGHPSNLVSLDAVMPSLFHAAWLQPIVLTLLTRLTPDMAQHAAQLSQALPGKFEVRCVPWSLSAQWQALANNDAVIIPSLVTEKKLVKSSNRMAESINAGRMVIANPLPSYEPFQPWAWIGEDLAEGLRWTLANRDVVPERIASAQRYVANHLSRPVIGRQWAQMLTELLP